MNDLFHYCGGNFCTTQDLHVHPYDLGFLRGYGVFDFVPVYESIPFRLLQHLVRFLESTEHIGIACPYSLFELEELASQLLEKSSEFTGGLRYILTGGLYQADTLLPESKPQLMILSELAPKKVPESIQVVTTTVMRTLPHVKTMNYLPAVMGMQKARKKGFHDALYVNAKGELLEGMTSNLFFVREGKLYTDDSDQIIKGITRSFLLDLAKDFMPIELTPINLSELPQCEEAFLTSSTKDLLPIVQIDDQGIGLSSPGRWTNILREQFLQKRIQELKKAPEGGTRRLM